MKGSWSRGAEKGRQAHSVTSVPTDCLRRDAILLINEGLLMSSVEVEE